MADETFIPQLDNIQPEEFSSKKKILIIVAIAVMAIVIGLVIWLVATSGNPPVSPLDGNPPGGLPQGEEIKQIVWKGYTNQKYNYLLKYPENWFIDTANAEKDFGANKVGGDLIISDKANSIQLLQSDNPPLDIKGLSLSVYQISAATTISQFIKDQKFFRPLSEADIAVSGLPAGQLVYTYDRKDVNKQVLDIVTLVKKDTKMFVFHYYTFVAEENKLPEDVVQIHDEILKSFEAK